MRLSEEASAPKCSLDARYRFRGSLKEDHGQPTFGCAFNPYISPSESPVVAVVGGNRISVYKCRRQGRPFRELIHFRDSTKEEAFYCCAWLLWEGVGAAQVLAAAGLTGTIRLVSVAAAALVRSLGGHGEGVNDLQRHPSDGALLVSAGADYTIRLWNVVAGDCVAMFSGTQGHRDQVLSVDVNPAGTLIVSGSMDHCVKVWDIGPTSAVGRAIAASHTRDFATAPRRRFATELVEFPRHSSNELHHNYVDCVRWVGGLIVSKACENEAFLWRFGDHSRTQLLREWELPNADVWFLKAAVNVRQRLVAAGTVVGDIDLLPLDDAGCSHTSRRSAPPPPSSKRARLTHRLSRRPIRQLAFSQCGTVLVAVCDDSTLHRWDLRA